MKLIIGLGNPGKEYVKTRHNIGFMALDALRIAWARYSVAEWSLSKKFNAEMSGCTINGEKIILAKPMTFMNDSGIAVRLIAEYYHLTHRDLIVVHDDKDLQLGDIRVQQNRSSAGHNGVSSIIEHIGTQDFTRVRIGVASENKKKMSDTVKFVLGKFGLFERKKVEETIGRVVEDIAKLLNG